MVNRDSDSVMVTEETDRSSSSSDTSWGYEAGDGYVRHRATRLDYLRFPRRLLR